MEISSRLEDYLEALFGLEVSGKKQTVSALAENLGLTKGTVVAGVKRMVDLKLAVHAAYGNVRLTEEGRRIGWRIFTKHERLKTFFHDFLDADEQRADEIACLIEHHVKGAIGDRFFNLVDFLYSAREADREWVRELTQALPADRDLPKPLTLCRGEEGIVCRLSGPEEIRLKLREAGIICGAAVENPVYNAASGEYRFFVSGKAVVLPEEEAATVWVRGKR